MQGWLTTVISLCLSRLLYLSCLQPVGGMGPAASIESILICPSLHILTCEMGTLFTLYGDGLAVQGHQHIRKQTVHSMLICLTIRPGKPVAISKANISVKANMAPSEFSNVVNLPLCQRVASLHYLAIHGSKAWEV